MMNEMLAPLIRSTVIMILETSCFIILNTYFIVVMMCCVYLTCHIIIRIGTAMGSLIII